GKANYAFMMDRFKRLQVGDLEWSSSIREWLRERESPGSCIYCGSREKLTVDHMIPLSRGGLDHPDNAVMVCGQCNSSKGDKRLYEFFGLEKRNQVPRIAEGKYLKLLHMELDRRGLLNAGRDNITALCSGCDLGYRCPEAGDLTVYCLEGMFKKS
ncbi:MAG: HNH endonuclease, partial [Candidatus Bathyarchaeota archaeon]